MNRNRDSVKGAVILETSMVLPLFMLMMLFLYGLLSVISVQNQMTHALIQSSKSLSLDPYLTEHVDSLYEANTVWSGLGSMLMDHIRFSNKKYFSSKNGWYKSRAGDADLAKYRFVGFLTGGDETAADERLKKLGIVNGLAGIGFAMTISGSDMTITIKYEIQFWFDAFDLGKIPMEQSIRTKLWWEDENGSVSSSDLENDPAGGGGGGRF